MPNTGFVVQGDLRNLEANRAVSDFDRTHRFSLSFVYEIPTFGRKNRAVTWLAAVWFLPGANRDALQHLLTRTGSAERLHNMLDLVRGSGGLYRLGFGRPGLCAVL